MSGRRFLDAAAVLKASRNVVAKHLALRQQRLDNYNKTSSVAKAIRSQTDRVTLTVKAASVLVDRFNGPGPEHITQASQSEWVTQNVRNGNGDSFTQDQQTQRENQFGERSKNDETTEQIPGYGNDLEQGKTISQSSLETNEPFTKSDASDISIPVGVKDDQERRTSSSLEDSTAGSTHGLPELKQQKSQVEKQESDDHIHETQVEQDVMPSSKSTTSGRFPLSQVMSEQRELPEEDCSGIFRSRKVSKTLRGQPPRITSSESLDSAKAEKKDVHTSKVTDESYNANNSLRQSSQSDLSKHNVSVDLEPRNLGRKGSENMDDLAADIAKDLEFTAPVPLASTPGPSSTSNKPAYDLRESEVPSSRISRIWQYGGLATSLAFGAVGESFRRATGPTQETGQSLIFSEANIERLVAKLSKMRGAALKLGQMMSFQDSKMLPKPIHNVLQRVQDSADYMPPSQRNRVLSSNLGPEWRSLFSTFDETPIAAASIGQVHRATLASTSQSVAVKVQYPGVASSIDSDLSNLAILLTASRLLPKGLYLDKTIANARVELAWECDYTREAEMGTRFRDLVADEADIYHVPAIIKEASGPQVLTAEFVEGIGVTKGQHFTQEQKDWIGSNILRLCLREIIEFRFMQTDPNWTNFLFNAQTHKLELLDFGASRDFPDEFILPYIRTLLAASRGDRNKVRDLSIELGYLTGHESQAMVNAHVNSVLTLAEPFAQTAPEVYDFRDQTITDRVREFIPVMLRERLAPPPEETYSIHRKLSGAFLLCAKLGSRVRCREMFEDAMGKAGVL